MITYEWKLETIDPDTTDDVVDSDYAERLCDLAAPQDHQRRVLVRHDDGVPTWYACVRSGRLPEFFNVDAATVTDIRVPKRFHTELKKVLA